jgi:hypothetical protein
MEIIDITLEESDTQQNQARAALNHFHEFLKTQYQHLSIFEDSDDSNVSTISWFIHKSSWKS